MRTAKPELQESVNKHGDESWEALFGQEECGLVQQSLGCLWGSALRVPLPQFLDLGFFLSVQSKKGASGVSGGSSGKDLSSYRRGFGSFVLLCRFVIRNKPLALAE